MTRYDEMPEAYPGQHAVIAKRLRLHGLVRHDPTERDRAAVARIGAGMLRAWPHARVWSPETLSLAAQVAAAGRDRTTMLPEAAFDWPIYRAALRPTLTQASQVLDDEIGLPSDVLASVERKRVSESELRSMHGDR